MALVAAALFSTIGCGSGGDAADDAAASAPTGDELAVCEQIQDLVDTIVGREAESAMQALDALERSIGSTGNDRLRTNGDEFFATINGTVADAEDLTPEESSEVGDDALARAQPRLDALLAECADLGLPIDRLPTDGPSR